MISYDDDHFDPPAPVARVRILNPASGASISEVPMLIDSGADVTLLPAGVISQIDVAAEGEQMLQAYDGSRCSLQVVHAAVRLDRFTFTGSYVVGQGDSGVLGRDILNRLRLDLNGPEGTWSLVLPASARQG